MKKMIMPLFGNVMIMPYEENPYVEKITKDGLLLDDSSFQSQDSGEVEKLYEMIRCGNVVEVGPMCKYLKKGDDVFYNYGTARPVPFQRQGFLLTNEQNILAVMNNDLDDRFKE